MTGLTLTWHISQILRGMSVRITGIAMKKTQHYMAQTIIHEYIMNVYFVTRCKNVKIKNSIAFKSVLEYSQSEMETPDV